MTAALPPGTALPERTRLFHIGPPKTATTAVQGAAAAARAALLEHGVRYPGKGLTQRTAVASFLGRAPGRPAPAQGRHPAAPSLKHWDDLVAEMESETWRHVLFGHEYAAGADDATARRFVDAIGPRLHVVVTLRPFGRMLPSIWQQNTKESNGEPFEPWLRRNLAVPRPPETFHRFHVRHDQGALVRRWAQAAGPENVTVVVLDPAQPRFVFTAFERMLALPDGLLADAGDSGPANRGLTTPETEMLRRVNLAAKQHGLAWSDLNTLLTLGAAKRLAEVRRPKDDEPRLRLPGWAAERADEEAARHAEEIAASGVRVLGDLATLTTPAPRAVDASEDHRHVEQVPVDAAVAALEGLLSAAVGRGDGFADAGAGRPVTGRRVGDVTSAELAKVLVARLRHRVGAKVRRGRG